MCFCGSNLNLNSVNLKITLGMNTPLNPNQPNQRIDVPEIDNLLK